jgi:hypothetical protein
MVVISSPGAVRHPLPKGDKRYEIATPFEKRLAKTIIAADCFFAGFVVKAVHEYNTGLFNH